MLQFSPRDFAIMEEGRQALGTADIGVDSEPIAGGWMVFVGPGSWANQACGLGFQGPVTDQELDRLVEFYVQRGVEPRIEVCSLADQTLIDGLAARGFQLREFESVLRREISATEDYRTLHSHGWPEDVELVQIDGEDDRLTRHFAELSTLAFLGLPGQDDGAHPELFIESTLKVVRHPRCVGFLARCDEQFVGGGIVESFGQLACLIATSVRPEYRRRGIQTALILRRLEHARTNGALLAAIHCQPGSASERNAMRVGFALAYSKVVMVQPGDSLSPQLG